MAAATGRAPRGLTMPTPSQGSAEQRQAAHEDWLGRVAAAAYKVDFYQALRRFASAHPHLPQLGEAMRPKDEPVRVAQPAELDFAPAPLHNWSDRQARRRACSNACSACWGPTACCPCT